MFGGNVFTKTFFENQVGCRYVWRSSFEKVGSSTFDSSAFGDFDAWATERSSDVRYYIFWERRICVSKILILHFHWVKLSPVGQSGVDNLTSLGKCCKVRKSLLKVGLELFLPPENSWTSRHLNGSMVAWLMRFPLGHFRSRRLSMWKHSLKQTVRPWNKRPSSNHQFSGVNLLLVLGRVFLPPL